MGEACRFEKTRGDQVTSAACHSESSEGSQTSWDKELIKKQVGRARSDVWDRLYRLNRFMAKLPRAQRADDGHAVRKVVGKARPTVR